MEKDSSQNEPGCLVPDTLKPHLIPQPLKKYAGVSGDTFNLLGVHKAWNLLNEADSTRKKHEELVQWARAEVSTYGLDVKDMNRCDVTND